MVTGNWCQRLVPDLREILVAGNLFPVLGLQEILFTGNLFPLRVTVLQERGVGNFFPLLVTVLQEMGCREFVSTACA